MASCSGPEPPLEEVEQPGDLEQLDRAVRAQFEELWRLPRDRGRAADVERGRAWGKLGLWFDVYGYPESAVSCYRNARHLDPEEPRWPFHLGVLAEQTGDLDGARGHYLRAAELAPEAVEPRVRLGDLALQRHDLDAAEARYREVLAEQPEAPGALFGTAQVALARGDAEAAIVPLDTLARLQPEAFEVQYALARAWRELGDEEKASSHLLRVPEEQRDQVAVDLAGPWMAELRSLDRGARTLTRRGVRAFRRGEHTEAAVLLGRAVTADPEGAEKRINYALALRETGHWSAALEQLEEALRLAEEGSELAARSHVELGRLFAVRGRPEAAALHLESALAIDPQSVRARVELGRLHHSQGRLEEALAQYAAAREIDPAGADARFWHAALLLVLDRRSEAQRALEEDLRRLGDERRLRLLLARVLSTGPDAEPFDVGRVRGLLEESAAELDLLFAETAAMVAAREGRLSTAIAWQQAAVEAVAGTSPRSVAPIARRRLELYRIGEICRNPWEAAELLIPTRVSGP